MCAGGASIPLRAESHERPLTAKNGHSERCGGEILIGDEVVNDMPPKASS